MMIGVAQVIGMKPTLRSFFSIGAALREHLGRGVEREELRDRGERGRGADRFQEGAARGVLRKHRPHHRGGDDALVAFVFALDRRALQRRHGVPFMLDLADVAAARAAGAVQSALRIERIVERRHRHAPIVAAASKARRGNDDFAMGVPIQRGKAPRNSIANSKDCVMQCGWRPPASWANAEIASGC